jgi:agmatinase
MDKAIDMLTPKVYLTIDLDGLDPSILPATGTPEPGGLGYYEVLGLVKKLIDRKELVGFDVVELAPIPGHKASDFLATKLIYQILSYKYSRIK